MGGPITDGLLEWPPDLFALTDVLLERAEAYRFVPSPPIGMAWPPAGDDDWCDAVADAALFVALDRSDGEDCIYRARGRELLARTGSLARFNPGEPLPRRRRSAKLRWTMPQPKPVSLPA